MGQLTPNIDTLVDDIYKLFAEGHTSDPRRVAELGADIAACIAARLEEPKHKGEPREQLRISNLGKGDRQLWYQKNRPDIDDGIGPKTRIKFLYGDLWERIMLFLAAEAGHEISHSQETVEVAGVVGHTDAVIDGVVVDTKSASPFGFKKFKYGTLKDDDSFGYMEQLAGYSEALGGLDGAFFAADKVSGELALLKVPRDELAALQIAERAANVRSVLESDETPDRCHTAKPQGESGNEVLNTNCSYCPYKFECWKDANDGQGLRTFLYSNGPTHFTRVEKEPKVLEITF